MTRPAAWQLRHPGERGFALLVVLWVLALIALVATRVLANGRLETRLAANLRDAAQAEAAANGAVFDTAFRVLQAGPPYRVGRGVQVMPLRGGGRAEIAIEPEAGKINPNIADLELLAALFRACGADVATATALTGAIDAWRTPNAPNTPNAVASYAAAGLDYGPPGAPFESLDELGLIPGMPPSLLACVLPRLSVFQIDDPDPALADPLVIAAMQDSGNAENSEADSQYVAVAITASATLAGGARFTRHAVLGIGPNAGGAWYRVLAWDTPPPS